jgi:hypothetical protein
MNKEHANEANADLKVDEKNEGNNEEEFMRSKEPISPKSPHYPQKSEGNEQQPKTELSSVAHEKAVT